MKAVSIIGLAFFLPISFSANASLPFDGHFISGLELGAANKSDHLYICQSYYDNYWIKKLYSSCERDQSGINVGTFVGYEVLYKKYVFGLESALNWGNDYLEHIINVTDGRLTVSTQRNGNYAISLRYGYTFKDGSIFYYRHGMQCVNDKFTVHYRDLKNSPIADSLEVRDINWRYFFGFGLEYFLFNKKNNSIRVEYYGVSGGPRYYSDRMIDYSLSSWSSVCKIQWVWHFI